MSEPIQSQLSNRLLKRLSAEDFRLLRDDLDPVQTQLHQTLIQPDVVIHHLYFPEVGFTSVTTTGAGRVELGLIGIEELVGASPLLLGVDRSPYEHFVQSSGEVLRIGAAELIAACAESPTLHRLLMRYVQTLLVQTAQTAFVNARLTIEARLARWLLMCQDRLPVSEMALTHEFLSMMLGVQRTSVTIALQVLEGQGLIRARRGRVEIRDRERLIGAAERGYGVTEKEYERLIESL